MKKHIYLFILVLAYSTLSNEIELPSHWDVISAKVVLIKVTETKNLFFQQKRTLTSLNRELISSGRVTITPSGLTQETLVPRYSWIRFDSHGVYTKRDSLSNEKINDDNNSVSTIMNTIFSILFAGDIAAISSQFELQYDESEKSWSLSLFPKERDLSRMIQSIILTGEAELQSIKIILNSGDSTLLSFAKVPYE